MRDLGLYKDLLEGTDNYNVFTTKVKYYIDNVRESINPELLAILKDYDLSYDEYCKRFFDFEKEKFKIEDFNSFITSFCDRIETIEFMNGSLK